jgi:hypothetical protein
MPLPALHSYFVGDVDGPPLLTVTEPLSAHTRAVRGQLFMRQRSR